MRLFFDKNKFFVKRAFSLVELSIGLIVVSLLITGIIGGRSLIPVYRLKMAQSLTQSSPVHSTEGLLLWLETTMPESFPATVDTSKPVTLINDSAVTIWNDINPQANKKSYAVASNGAVITYKKESAISTLPALKFNGAQASNFLLSKTSSLSDAYAIKSSANAFTVFMVAKADDAPAGSNSVVFANGPTSGANASGYAYGLEQNMKRMINFSGVFTIDTVKNNGTKNPEVISMVYQGGSGGEIKLYTNGTGDAGSGASGTSETLSASNITAKSPLSAFYIGGTGNNDSWNGLISEIIVFNRALSDSERKEIESYLGQKYNININTKEYDGSCVVAINGIEESSVPTGSSGTLTCVSPQYSGSMNYSCSNGSLTISNNSCGCGSGYVLINGLCETSCSTGSTVGITSRTVSPSYSTQSLDCDISGYTGTVNYTCVQGIFRVIGGGCAMPSCQVSFEGISPTSVAGTATTESLNCNADGYSGTINYTCINGVFAATSGSACTKSDCVVSANGVSTPTGVKSGSGVLQCNATGYSNDDSISYTCSDSVFTVTDSSACDTCATDYSLLNGQCKKKCNAVASGIYSTVVPPTSSVSTLACDDTLYNPGTLSYTCVDGVFTVTNNGCTLLTPSCPVSMNGISQTQVSYGSGTLTCSGSYSGTVSYTCSKTGGFVSYEACKENTANCTGGTLITTVTGQTIHRFTSSGTLTCTASKTAQVLVVGGGGSGGSSEQTYGAGGGGGGGVVYSPYYSLDATSYTVTVGGAGNSVSYSSNGVKGNNGGNSVFGTITAYGGGGGGSYTSSGATNGNSGGSGGGGGGLSTIGGAYTQNGQSNATNYYGNLGGMSYNQSPYTGGGGGGAGGAGSDANSSSGGAGGSGITHSITGTAVIYGSGGGGSGGAATTSGGSGGSGAGNGGNSSSTSGTAGTANTGGGGGGANKASSGAGGSGVVVVRYGSSGSTCPYGYAVIPATDQCTKYCSVSVTGSNSFLVFNGSGSLSCDQPNYTGSVSYTCDAISQVVVTTGSCSCATGYTGPTCSSCAAGYTMINNTCQYACPVSMVGYSKVSVPVGTSSFTCDQSGYSGTVSYTCSDGVFTTDNACVMSSPASNCTGGNSIDTTTLSGYVIHKFTSSGTLSCPTARSGQVLVVAGGGAGAYLGGGGGGGGVVYNNYYFISSGSTSVTVGSGGAAVTNASGNSGGNSVFGTIIAYGGGGGSSSSVGSSGGSGGGSARDLNSTTGGAVTAGVGGTSYGNVGGGSMSVGWDGGGGGGGAGAAGSRGFGNATNSGERGGAGGAGMSFTITGSSVTYAGGGGGGNAGNTNLAAGGAGGGGAGSGGNNGTSTINAVSGTANTGGGGGGGNTGSNSAGSGGSGIVIVRLPAAGSGPSCPSGYNLSGSTCVKGCAVSVLGVSSTVSVAMGSGNLTCDDIGYSGSVPYTCGSGGSLTVTGSCSCGTNYTMVNGSCTCPSGYSVLNGACYQNCTINSVTGINAGTAVNHDSTSLTCNASGYAGTIYYTCNNGTFTKTSGSCVYTPCTGGTIDTTTVSGSVILKFTSSGTMTCTASATNAQILVVGGGGSGGSHSSSTNVGGGGGGGVVYATGVSLSTNTYTITVAGTASGSTSAGNNGGNSVFSGGGISITAYGGGGGGGNGSINKSGGSGGGGHGSPANPGGSATQGIYSGTGSATVLTYGNSGGAASSPDGSGGGGGGGGANSAGGSASGTAGGNGGSGVSISITGSAQIYGSGGGGNGSGTKGSGGTNAGSADVNMNAVDNYGGGGGAKYGATSGSGGSGVVIIRY